MDGGIPTQLSPGGARFPQVTLLPPGSKVAAYVRSGGPRTGEVWRKDDIVTTLDAAAKRVRDGLGDVIIVARDHAETFAVADSVPELLAGTTIIGLGDGEQRPSFTWTATAASLLFNVANVTIYNCRLFLAGSTASTTALTVTAPITVSAAGCGIENCYINFGVDADQLCTVGITTTAAATGFRFNDNDCYGATASECTTFLRIVGTDRFECEGNFIQGATSAVAIGLIQFITTDSLGVRMGRKRPNYIRNNKAASTAAITVSAGATTSSGIIDQLYATVLANGANQLVLGHADGAFAASVAAFTFGRHVNVANLAGERMAEVTVVSA